MCQVLCKELLIHRLTHLPLIKNLCSNISSTKDTKVNKHLPKFCKAYNLKDRQAPTEYTWNDRYVQKTMEARRREQFPLVEKKGGSGNTS